jgi:hypothetical protein
LGTRSAEAAWYFLAHCEERLVIPVLKSEVDVAPDPHAKAALADEVHRIAVEREVEVDAEALQEDASYSRDSRIARADARELGDHLDGATKVRREDVDVFTVGDPPVAFS